LLHLRIAEAGYPKIVLPIRMIGFRHLSMTSVVILTTGTQCVTQMGYERKFFASALRFTPLPKPTGMLAS